MKTRSALSERASNIRSDYAPLAAPPNPRADEAKAAMREYMLPTLVSAPKGDDAVFPMNDEAIAQVEHVLEKHGELTDEALLALARAAWPSMRLLDTATVGRGVAWDAERQQSVELEGVVVVEVLGIDARPAASADERTSACDGTQKVE